MRTIFFTVGLLVLAILAAPLRAREATDAPKIYTSDGRDLAAAKEKYQAGDKKTVKAVKKILKDADEALTLGPFSVVQKDHIPPSGDKHDYASLSPYWWPDPNKPDGKPYIRKDGEFNPEREKYDLGPLDKMSKAVEALGTAYYFTGEEKYAQKAAELIRTWFLEESTKMNPHLTFAQFVPGYTEPRPSGVIEGGRFRRVIDGEILIAGSQHWSADESAKLKAWFADLLKYLQTSKQGKEEAGQPNNHGSWCAVQMSTYALYTGQSEVAKKIIEKQFTERVEKQIKADGSQPEELARTLSFHYSRYNLNALQDLAMLGERVGLDLWNFKGKSGQGMRTAIDYLLPATLGEGEWKHQQIKEKNVGDMIQILRRAANAYNDDKYEAAARKLQEKDPRETVDLLFPSRVQ